MKDKLIALFRCDLWKSKNSRHLVGWFSDSQALREQLKEYFQKGFLYWKHQHIKDILNKGCSWDECFEVMVQELTLKVLDEIDEAELDELMHCARLVDFELHAVEEDPENLDIVRP